MAPSKKGSKLKDDVVEDLVKRCQLGDAAGLKEMLAKYGSKLQINEPLHGEYFLLRYAVEKGSVDTVQVLLDHGAEPNLGVTDSYWHYAAAEPPLYTAAAAGKMEIVKMLLAAGANPLHEINGRKAKTMSKDSAIAAVIREAEGKWKASQAA